MKIFGTTPRRLFNWLFGCSANSLRHRWLVVFADGRADVRQCSECDLIQYAVTVPEDPWGNRLRWVTSPRSR